MSETAFNDPVILAGIEQRDPEAPMSPGAQLASLRQARGWSIEDVATQLNLAPRQIMAIESDNYTALPGIAIVRGFIRGYAKILKIDATPLLQIVASENLKLSEPISERRPLSTPFSETRLPSMGRQGLPSKKLFWIAFLLLLLLAAFASQQLGWVPGFSDSVSSKIKDIASASMSIEGATTNTTASLPVAESGNAALRSTAGVANSEPVLASVPVAAPQPVLTRPMASADAQPGPPAQASTSKNALVLTLRQDSWVEVTRANRTSLVSRLMKAGSTETVEISEPVSLTIGNVAGVDATWRGVPLDIKSGTKTNVNRLSLK